MPIYVYKCEKCGKKEEKLRAVSSIDVTVACPEKGCKGVMPRVPATTSFQLKGGGWFKDSYPD